MNKNLIVIIVLIVLIGAGLFFVNSQSTKVSEVSNTKDIDSQISPSQDQSTNNANSKYVEYSKETLDRAKGARRVLYFYASWCPTCRIADPDLAQNVNKFPEDLIVIRVNYNDPDTNQEEKDLAKKYAVTYQHTFVQIDNSGNEIKKWNGGKTEELLANIR